MPAHVSAADAPQDLWQCHECGWTYPNHHPSAKHRRNHKKHCGKQVEVTSTGQLKSSTSSPSPRVAPSSSDDASTDEGHGLSSLQDSGGKYDHPAKPAPHPEEAAVEKIVRGGEESVSLSGLASNRSFEAVELTISDDANATSNATNHETGHNNQDSTRRSSHTVTRGMWTCRHCGWTYPNAHPSAKHRRKHKKKCGAGAGGSSDDASSDEDHRHQKENAGAQEDTILNEDSAGLQAFPPLDDSKSLDNSNIVEQKSVVEFTKTSITEVLLKSAQSVVTTTTSHLTQVTEVHASGNPIRIECPVPRHAVVSDGGATRSNPGSPNTAGQWQLRSMKSLIQEVVQNKVPLKLESCDSQASLFAESTADVPEVPQPEKISTAASQGGIVEKWSEKAIDEGIESGDEALKSQIPRNSMAAKDFFGLPAAEKPMASVYQVRGEMAKRNANWHLISMKSLLNDSETIKQGTAVTKSTLSQVAVTKTTYANRAPNVPHPPPAVVNLVDEEANSGSKVDDVAVTDPVEEKATIVRSEQLPKGPSPIDSSRQPISKEELDHQEPEVVVISERKTNQVPSKKGSKELDSTVSKAGDVDQQDLTASNKQGSEKPQSSQHPLPVIADEGVNKVIIQQGCDSGSIKSSVATSVTLEPSTTSVTQKASSYSSWSPSLKKPESGSQDKIAGKSESPKPQCSPGSPEGWVRARVEAFEKMAGVDPLMCHRKSMSPLKSSNPNTPVARKSSQLHESPKDLQDTISQLRHQQNSKRWESEALANVVSPEVHDMI